MKLLKLFILIILFSFSGIANAQSKSEKNPFSILLDDFCKAYYDETFGPSKYVAGSLKVTSIENNKGIINIVGSYTRSSIILFICPNEYLNRFKAKITIKDLDLEIDFWRWHEEYWSGDGYWEGPLTKTIPVETIKELF